MCGCPRSYSYSVSPLTPPYTPPSSALPRAPARPATTTTRPCCPRLQREDAPIPPSHPPPSRRGPGSSSFPTSPHPSLQAGHSGGPAPGGPLTPPALASLPFPAPGCPHPRVQRGRGLPQAAASASSPRGSWCLPGPTGLTRTTQPQDVRSDGTTASCHAPPLPPPPASSPPRISPPTPPSRARHKSKGGGGRFTALGQSRANLGHPLFLLFGTAPSY
nr:uncharacterized protein LOC127483125 [Oryctolagus cuniculus]